MLHTAYKPITFLLVEDNEGHATLFKNLIKREGLVNKVIVYSDGSQALSRICQWDSSDSEAIVVLDLNLPLIHGSHIVHPIRQRHPADRLPIIVVSTSMDQREIDACSKFGTQAHLRKPLTDTLWRGAIKSLGSQYRIVKTDEGDMLVRT